jgi:hypothetical protein
MPFLATVYPEKALRRTAANSSRRYCLLISCMPRSASSFVSNRDRGNLNQHDLQVGPALAGQPGMMMSVRADPTDVLLQNLKRLSGAFALDHPIF